MAQTALALLCVGSLLASYDVVVIRCDHPASPFAPPAPPIAVPRIQALGIEAVTPDLAEEGGKAAYQHKVAPAEGREHEHQASSSKGGVGPHQHGAASAKAGAAQHHYQALPATGDSLHRPTNRGEQQHRH